MASIEDDSNGSKEDRRRTRNKDYRYDTHYWTIRQDGSVWHGDSEKKLDAVVPWDGKILYHKGPNKGPRKEHEYLIFGGYSFDRNLYSTKDDLHDPEVPTIMDVQNEMVQIKSMSLHR